MIITNIIGKKNGRQFDIYIDNILKFTLDTNLILKFGVTENMTVDEEWLNNIEGEIQYKKAYEYTLRALSICDNTSGEIRKKLYLKEYSEEIIDRVIKKLLENEYLDDEKYIDRWINDKSKIPGMSKKVIYYKLLQKGLNKELLDRKFNEVDIDDYKLALLAAEKKMKTIHGDKEHIKRKIFSYLKGKGYNNDTCFKVIENLIQKEKWD